MTMANIVASFRTTGVYPINRNAIELQISSPEQIEPVCTSLYIPAKSHGQQMIKLYYLKLSDDTIDSYSPDDSASNLNHTTDHESCLKNFSRTHLLLLGVQGSPKRHLVELLLVHIT